MAYPPPRYDDRERYRRDRSPPPRGGGGPYPPPNMGGPSPPRRASAGGYPEPYPSPGGRYGPGGPPGRPDERWDGPYPGGPGPDPRDMRRDDQYRRGPPPPRRFEDDYPPAPYGGPPYRPPRGDGYDAPYRAEYGPPYDGPPGPPPRDYGMHPRDYDYPPRHDYGPPPPMRDYPQAYGPPMPPPPPQSMGRKPFFGDDRYPPPEPGYPAGPRGNNVRPNYAPNQTVVLMGLPATTDNMTLRRTLDEMGINVESVSVIIDKKTGQSKRYGFARFYTLEQARAFVEPNFPMIPWREAGQEEMRVRIDYSANQKAPFDHNRQDFQRNAGDDKRKADSLLINDGTKDMSASPTDLLLLRGLSPDSQPGAIAEALDKMPGWESKVAAGAHVQKVFVIRDRVTKQGWGYAFAQFSSVSAATEALMHAINPAIHPQGFVIGGRGIIINFAAKSAFIPAFGRGDQWSITDKFGKKHMYWDTKAFALVWEPTAPPPTSNGQPPAVFVPAQTDASATALGTAAGSEEALRALMSQLTDHNARTHLVAAVAAATPKEANADAQSTEKDAEPADAESRDFLPKAVRDAYHQHDQDQQSAAVDAPNNDEDKMNVDAVVEAPDQSLQAGAPEASGVDAGAAPSNDTQPEQASESSPAVADGASAATAETAGDLTASDAPAPDNVVSPSGDKSAAPAQSEAQSAMETPATAPAAATDAKDSKKAADLIASRKAAVDIMKWNQVQTDKSTPLAAPEASPEIVDEFEFGDAAKRICLLCQRQFKSLDDLKRHNDQSNLHKTNLANPECIQRARGMKSMAKTSTPTKYRDRASERREIFGQPDTPEPAAKRGRRNEDAVVEPAAKNGLAEDNVGNKMLAKMGWEKGQGLGSNASGVVEPIATNVYAQGAGLGASKGVAAGQDTNSREYGRDKARDRYEG